ncbi:MAG TPA: tRNA (N6-isopentenyl adenosine(37)-C2)-methylthiotransferase MiaB [bacterium]|nr:tRNA (N6-isopentenyl adenosine(37)-C2)-methylthiotransferase MiaB [bacterium]HQL63295.1 tRNA (N6-isopentenyl adenosine(37)-C2)-methylthiotransferase MiaB [bacterium]
MKFHLQTYGCQMNVYDSESIAGILRAYGHETVSTVQEADIALINTCSVRRGAETRVLGQLGHLKTLKSRGIIRYIAVCGCMAQKHGENLLKERDYIDLVLGPAALSRLPHLLDRLENHERPIVELSMLDIEDRADFVPSDGPISYPCFVTIMKGCNRRCSYCVVPETRGPERSRSPQHVLDEIRRLVDRGYREVTLLGQTVNSYRYDDKGFVDLLEKVNAIEGLRRIRFTTSHPADTNERLLFALRDLEKVCEQFHLPVQSGSNRILSAMRRNHTREDYLRIIDRLRDIFGGVSAAHRPAISTDLIVGFPGETESDFEETVDLMQRIRWDSAFMFKYSIRPGTYAATLPEHLDEETKARRLARVIELQHQTSREINQRLLGETLEVMLDQPSADKRRHCGWDGRSRQGKTVKVSGVSPDAQPGDILCVRITQITSYTLFGDVVSYLLR